MRGGFASRIDNLSGLSHDRKMAPERNSPGQELQLCSKGERGLALAERPANGCDIFGHPVASELEEVIHVMRIHLRLDEQVMGCIDAESGRHVDLEVV